jgi:hypothetical protein
VRERKERERVCVKYTAHTHARVADDAAHLSEYLLEKSRVCFQSKGLPGALLVVVLLRSLALALCCRIPSDHLTRGSAHTHTHTHTHTPAHAHTRTHTYTNAHRHTRTLSFYSQMQARQTTTSSTISSPALARCASPSWGSLPPKSIAISSARMAASA